ncbi:unnamed protein product [Effrenium voratum]|nr:unnamed protein product [Effrenium voratum]
MGENHSERSAPVAMTDVKEMHETPVTQTQMFKASSQAADEPVQAVLVALRGAEPAEFKFQADTAEVLVGRNPKCQVQAKDKHVSSQHLRIYRDERLRFYVEELASSGCFINNQFVRQGEHRALRHGDAITIATNASSSQEAFASLIFRVMVRKNSEDLGSPKAEGTEVRREADLRNLVSDDWVPKNWDISHELGTGNFSEVKLGIEVKEGKKYAMKIIDKKKFLQFQHKRGSVLSLNDEADMMKSLSHPNIVTCRTWFQTEAHMYIALELVEGGDLLKNLLEDGCFQEVQAARIFLMICNAVSYLHERQLVHRDLKPENILLTSKDRETMVAKLADFGLARQNLKSRDCRTFCGTPHYFAPEVITTFTDTNTKAGYGKEVDMWSLGVILYILLSSTPPFEEEGLYNQIVEGRYEFDVQEWTCVSPEAKELVQQMMTVSPSKRINIQQALNHPWLKFVRFTPTPMRSGAGFERPPAQEPAAKRRKSDAAM